MESALNYILYLLNDVCIFGEMQEAEANRTLMDTLNGDIQILQLAEDCYKQFANKSKVLH